MQYIRLGLDGMSFVNFDFMILPEIGSAEIYDKTLISYNKVEIPYDLPCSIVWTSKLLIRTLK